MRRCIPLCLALLAFACKSSEDKACENTVRIIEASAAETGRSDGKSRSQHQRNCIDSLGRLRHEIQPDEEMWFTYLRCLRAAKNMSDQSECLAPLTAMQAQQILEKTPVANKAAQQH